MSEGEDWRTAWPDDGMDGCEEVDLTADEPAAEEEAPPVVPSALSLDASVLEGPELDVDRVQVYTEAMLATGFAVSGKHASAFVRAARPSRIQRPRPGVLTPRDCSDGRPSAGGRS